MKKLLAGLFFILFSLSLSADPISPVPGLIPKPWKMKVNQGNYQFPINGVISYNGAEAAPVAGMMGDFLETRFQCKCEVRKSGKIRKGINLVVDPAFEKDAYKLEVTSGGVLIKGSPSGLFYGMQTLIQLMPAVMGAPVLLPQISIEDKPRFGYRGAMLDVGRYFFTVDEVKRFIDQMAFYKLNIFHFHLTEDGGWRVEIRKYPKLTEIGAWRRGTQTSRQPDGFDKLPHGGFYTQEELRELVAYAQQRHITIVPEIDMPGHTMSALAAYPEYSCTGGPFKVLEMWGIQKDILCAGNEATFGFVEDILDELLDIFPSPIIHVGGDEAPKERWSKCPKCQERIRKEGLKDEHELQSYFIGRISRYLEQKGRKLLGWDEILEGGLTPNAMVMSWRGEKGGIEAARQKHEVVMVPSSFLYLDYYQGKPDGEPFNIGGNLPLEKVYHYEPYSAQMTPEEHKYIVGVQGNIWMEFIHSVPKIDYMGFPRLCALAETAWSPEGKDYKDFTSRLSSNLLWLEQKSVNFRIPEPYGLKDTETSEGEITVQLEPPVQGSVIYFTLNGEDPLLTGEKYTKPLVIRPGDSPVTLKCVVRTPKGRVSGTYSAKYTRKQE